VSNGTIQNWVKEAARTLPEAEITEIEFDEMWHYIVKKKVVHKIIRRKRGVPRILRRRKKCERHRTPSGIYADDERR